MLDKCARDARRCQVWRDNPLYSPESLGPLREAYRKSYTDRTGPCDLCDSTDSPHFHASVHGECLCAACYKQQAVCCTQVYPGDYGFPIAQPIG